MEKIIIQNESDLSLLDAVECVIDVISKGKISANGTQYCYLTIFTIEGRSYDVYAQSNKLSYKFKII